MARSIRRFAYVDRKLAHIDRDIRTLESLARVSGLSQHKWVTREALRQERREMLAALRQEDV